MAVRTMTLLRHLSLTTQHSSSGKSSSSLLRKSLDTYVRGCCRRHSREVNTSGSGQDDVTNIVRSPFPSVTVPDVPFAQFMFSSLRPYGDKIAVIDHLSGRQWTFRQVIDDSVRLASGLTRLGLRKGDTLLLMAFNCPEHALITMACAACGIIVSSANPVYTPEELCRQLQLSGSVGLFVGQSLVEVVNKALDLDPQLRDKVKSRMMVIGEAEGYRPVQTLLEDDGKAFPDSVTIDPGNDVMVLPFSSGTTGMPKGVMLTHTNIIANVLQQLDLTVGDRVLGVLPFYHIYGMVLSQWCTLQSGKTLVILPRFQPQDFLSSIQSHKVTILHLVPPLVLFLAKDPQVPHFDLSSVQKVLCGAAPLGEGISQQFSQRFDALLMQVYGLTECSPLTHFNNPPIKFGTIGHVISTSEAKMVDMDTGRALGPGETGELYVRGPQVMKGYFNNPKATADTLLPGGWVRTGDIGHYDKDGFFTITDRLKELIKYKGFQVAPAELEALLLTHPDVLDVAVIGVEDEAAGEVPKAFVVPRPGVAFTTDNVLDFLHSKVANYKRLRGGLEVVDAIPKTASGKILRRVLKDK